MSIHERSTVVFTGGGGVYRSSRNTITPSGEVLVVILIGIVIGFRTPIDDDDDDDDEGDDGKGSGRVSSGRG